MIIPKNFVLVVIEIGLQDLLLYVILMLILLHFLVPKSTKRVFLKFSDDKLVLNHLYIYLCVCVCILFIAILKPSALRLVTIITVLGKLLI